MPSSRRVERLAVPVLAGMGNALLAQPMARQLQQAFPGARLRIFARTSAIGAAFENLPETDAIEIFGNRAREFFRLIHRLRAWRADVCVIPYPSNRWQYSVLAAMCGARRVILHSYDVGYWRAMHFLPGERVPAEEGAHDLIQNLRLLRPLGVEPDETMHPVFPLVAADVSAARARLPAGDVVAMHSGSGDTVFGEAKRWSTDRYARLIARLRDELGLSPVMIEGPDEAGVAAEIASMAGDLPILSLRGPLKEAAAILAACRLYVGNDSGLAHLAAAVGTPPVTLFGPARPDELCPFGYRHLVVQTPAPCAPCFAYPTRAVTPHVACRPPYCVNLIEIESVMIAVRRALRGEAQSSKTAASSALPLAAISSSAAGSPGRRPK